MPDYTREDWDAWVEVHPYDADLEAAMTTTLSFTWFVLGRRFSDVWREIKKSWRNGRTDADSLEEK
jgi:hypothetical protein